MANYYEKAGCKPLISTNSTCAATYWNAGKTYNKWKATYPRTNKYLGYFHDEDDAARAYNAEVRRLGGAVQLQ